MNYCYGIIKSKEWEDYCKRDREITRIYRNAINSIYGSLTDGKCVKFPVSSLYGKFGKGVRSNIMAICKFRVGDKVRRINHHNNSLYTTFEVGQVGTVVKIRDDTFVDVKVNGGVNEWNDVANLELVESASPKFKVGDRVMVDGMPGTIICITILDHFGVQFDDKEYQGHSCVGVPLKAGKASTDRNCWWVHPENVTRYEEPKYWTGRAVCIGNCEGDTDFIVGKIYNIDDGKFTDERGRVRPINHERVVNPEDLTKGEYWKWWTVKFIPIVE